jgi:inner membrane protein
MPTVLTHALVGAALGEAAPAGARSDIRFWCTAVVCSMLPDLDVIGFSLGLHYGDLWGHRGMTHSLLFALIIGGACGVWLGKCSRERWSLALLLFVITASHGVLDAMTDGGLGVAFFSPLDPSRYFFSWRPIHVSPIGLYPALSARGMGALWSEILYVWPPAILTGGLLYAFRVWQGRAERSAPPKLAR